MFLHYILNENENSLIFKFLKSQRDSRVKENLEENLEDMKIGLTLEEIKKITKQNFTKIVNESVRKKALKTFW